MNKIFRNSEGYYDGTAGKAILNTMREAKDYPVGTLVQLGKKQKNGKGLLLKKHEKYYTMLFVFDKENDHVNSSFSFDGIKYFYDSGRLNYVFSDEVGEDICEISETVMDDIKNTLIEGLGLDGVIGTPVAEAIADAEIKLDVVEELTVDFDVDEEIKLKIAKLEAERDAYKDLCMQMMKISA